MVLKIDENTPVISYELEGREIFVKRDDLMGDNITLPPWGKLAAIKMLFEYETPLGMPYIEKSKPVTYLCLRSSWSGWALGEIGTKLGFDIRVGFPNSKNYPKEMLERIEATGATLVPVKPNMLKVCLAILKKKARDEGWQEFPYAFETPQYLKHFANRISEYNDTYDNLVCIGGTPCTAIGLSQGFKGKNIHMVLTCSEDSAKNQLKKYGLDKDKRIKLHTTPYDFYDELEWLDIPFDANRHWESKSWWWLTKNIDKIEGSVLYWNLGGAINF